MSRQRLSSLVSAAMLVLLAACTATPESVGSQSHADTDSTEPARAVTTQTIRIVASNTTSGNLQSYDPGDGQRILQALKPDVTLMQEFNFGNNSPEAIRGFVDATFGPEFTYYRETGHAQIPNGVVSRFPIRESGYWQDPQTSTRSFAWARIDLPGEHDLWAISVHLLTSGASRRSAQAQAIVSQIRNVVPAGDYLTIGGDFNTTSRTEGCLQTLGQYFKVTGPFPVDTRNNGGTSANRSKPYDWVLVSRDLDALQVPAVVGGISFPAGMVFDSRNFDPLQNVTPVRRGDSGASNMQHMAVARDFAIPVPAAEVPVPTEPNGTNGETNGLGGETDERTNGEDAPVLRK
jgi:endonuclease/exonuclease/phosphatase family metal-dependent hydrolase